MLVDPDTLAREFAKRAAKSIALYSLAAWGLVDLAIRLASLVK